MRPRLPDPVWERLRASTLEHLRRYHTGGLLEADRQKWIEAHTYDPYRSLRQYLFDLLRQPGGRTSSAVKIQGSRREVLGWELTGDR